MIGTFGEEFDAVIVIQVGVEEHIVKKPVRRLVQQDGSCGFEVSDASVRGFRRDEKRIENASGFFWKIGLIHAGFQDGQQAVVYRGMPESGVAVHEPRGCKQADAFQFLADRVVRVAFECMEAHAQAAEHDLGTIGAGQDLHHQIPEIGFIQGVEWPVPGNRAKLVWRRIVEVEAVEQSLDGLSVHRR